MAPPVRKLLWQQVFVSMLGEGALEEIRSGGPAANCLQTLPGFAGIS